MAPSTKQFKAWQARRRDSQSFLAAPETFSRVSSVCRSTTNKRLKIAAQGKSRRIYLGLAIDETTNESRHFVLMAGIGLDASVVRRVQPSLKKRIGKGAFWVSGFSHLATWNPRPFTLEINGHKYTSTFAAIGKAARYGGDLAITPGARLDRPEFEICIIDTMSRLRYLHLLSHAMRDGMPRDTPEVRFVKATSVKAYGDAQVQIDGELIGHLPMRFEIAPHSLERNRSVKIRIIRGFIFHSATRRVMLSAPPSHQVSLRSVIKPLRLTQNDIRLDRASITFDCDRHRIARLETRQRLPPHLPRLLSPQAKRSDRSLCNPASSAGELLRTFSNDRFAIFELDRKPASNGSFDCVFTSRNPTYRTPRRKATPRHRERVV